MNKDYEEANNMNLTKVDRWQEGVPHHPMSQRLMEFLAAHDSADYDGYFDWRTGGDGDNGETLMYQMDAFFEMQDKVRKEAK